MAHVYWIHLPEHTDIFQQGYVGVSKKADDRINNHFRMLEKQIHENEHLTNAYDKYKKLVYTLVLEAEENYCYEIENKLRPDFQIGWNQSPGGYKPPTVRKGHGKGRKLSEKHKQKIKESSYFNEFNKSEERKLLTSKTMKGKPKSEEQKRKQSESMIGKMTGEANPSKREEVRAKLSEARKKWWAEKKRKS